MTDPVARLVVNNGTTGAGSAGDAVAAYANTANSVIFAQQESTSGSNCAACFVAPNATGAAAGLFTVAGTSTNQEGVGLFARHEYFVPSGSQQNLSWTRAGTVHGDLEVYQSNISPSGWPNWGYIGDVVKILADVPGGSDGGTTGFPLHAVNLNPTGFSARFVGAVRIEAAPGGCSGACAFARAALEVRNTHSGGSGVSATGIQTAPASGGIGLDAYGQSIALRASGSGAGTYAGRFVGKTLLYGYTKKKQNATAPALDLTTWLELNGSVVSEQTTCANACGGFDRGTPPGETGQCLAAFYAPNSEANSTVLTSCALNAYDAWAAGWWGIRCLCR